MKKSEIKELRETARMFIYAINKKNELLERTKNEEVSDEEIEEVNKEIEELAVFVEELVKRDNVATLRKAVEIVKEKMQ